MQYLHNSNDSEWKKKTIVLIKVNKGCFNNSLINCFYVLLCQMLSYYSSRFLKYTNAFWYFCADILYVLFPWEVFINKYFKKFCNICSSSFCNILIFWSIFKKVNGSLKIFFEAGWNREYFVFVKISDNSFALNQRDILLRSQFILEKRSSTFMPAKNKLLLSANMTDLVFLSIYKDRLCKLRRAMGSRWIPRTHHIRYLGRQISWCDYRRHRRCIDFGLKDNFWTIINMYRLFHIVLVYVKVFHDLLCQILFKDLWKLITHIRFFSKD